jgi:hypothetical protein
VGLGGEGYIKVYLCRSMQEKNEIKKKCGGGKEREKVLKINN